jgi:low affinity Fe/Cu permease
MPRQRENHSSNSKPSNTRRAGPRDDAHNGANNHRLDWFTWFAHETARLSGRPVAFIVASGIIVAWAVGGPLFDYSDTWQLVINTGTTIVTFLMVFLIQNTQNRDTMALQVKLADLIIAVRGAHNQLAAAEDLSEADLEALHAAYRQRAEETLASLEKRRATRAAT